MSADGPGHPAVCRDGASARSPAERLAGTGSFWSDILKDPSWHFEPGRAEDIRARNIPIGNIDDFLRLSQIGSEKTLATSLGHAKATDEVSHKIKRDLGALADAAGYPRDLVYAVVTDCFASGHERAAELGASLGLRDCYIKVHCQKPGQVWPLHVDNFHAFRNHPSVAGQGRRVRRYALALSEWCWGQMFQIGNAVWTHWHIGDCVELAEGVPHSSANASPFDRISLIVTGTE